MKWIALCHLGAEPAVASELTEFSLEPTEHVGCCVFEASKQQAADFLYKTQCTIRLLAAVDHGSYDSLDLTPAHDLIPEDATFCVRVDLIAGGPADTSSQELAYTYGGQIDRKVNLDNPDYTVYVQAGSESFAGIDVSGDLSKRYYRIFTNSRSMKGTLVASALRMFEVYNKSLLDPFGNTGEVCIEAALSSTNTSALKFRKFERYPLLEQETASWSDDPLECDHPIYCLDDQLGNLRSCKKNSKLAGVQDCISFSKSDPEWLDVKFEENHLEAIATIPPPVTKRNPTSDHLEELCYQAEFVLKNKGRLVVICLTPETSFELSKHAKKHSMKLIREHVLYSGQLAVQVVEYGL